jgi:hypothetical protein
MALIVKRAHREVARSGPLRPAEEVTWALAEEYAALVDDARVDGDRRSALSAAEKLEELLERLDVKRAEGEHGSKPDPTGLYGLPATMGDAAHA